MSNTELAVIEKIIEPLKPRFEDILKGTGLSPSRLMQTFYFAIESNPRLMRPEFRASLPRACMSFGCLGVEVDGVTGQGFVIPFGTVAQPLLGYKGYPTIGARSGVSFQMGVIREGDDYDYQAGSGGYVRVRPMLGKEATRKIIGAWAVAEHRERPSVPLLISLDECMAIKAKSHGAKKPGSPWNDINGPGFAAMCAKTALRRVGKLIPVRGVQIASRMEEAFEEQGQTSFVDPDHGLIIDGEAHEVPKQDPAELTQAPSFEIIDAKGEAHSRPTIQQWRAAIVSGIEGMADEPERLDAFVERNKAIIDRLGEGFPGDVDAVKAAIEKAGGKI